MSLLQTNRDRLPTRVQHFPPLLGSLRIMNFLRMMYIIILTPPTFAGECQAQGEVHRLPPHDLSQHSGLRQEKPHGKQKDEIY